MNNVQSIHYVCTLVNARLCTSGALRDSSPFQNDEILKNIELLMKRKLEAAQCTNDVIPPHVHACAPASRGWPTRMRTVTTGYESKLHFRSESPRTPRFHYCRLRRAIPSRKFLPVTLTSPPACRTLPTQSTLPTRASSTIRVPSRCQIPRDSH